MNDSPYDLEAKAAEERKRLHATVAELRSCLRDAVDVKKNARRHLGVACGVAAVLGLTTGYSLAGIFATSRRGIK
jgi:hypothetical protein